MKLTYLFLLILVIPIAELHSQNIQVKSLRVYSGSDETSFPLISQNAQYYSSSNQSADNITIDFDMQSDHEPDLNIIFRFCDRHWIPTNNIFLLNQGKNTAYNLRFTLLPGTIKEAKYHFTGSYPDSRGLVDFPFSGKWMFFITDAQDTSIIYGSGKFFVVKQDVALRDTLKNEQLEDKIYFPSDLAKVFNITTTFNLPDGFYPSSVSGVEIIENRKIDIPIVIGKHGNTLTRQYYWDGNKKFSFTARDILPGNEYREVDLRNTNKFISKDVTAQFDGLEYSRFFKQGNPDLNGASILTNFNDDYADYLNVTFSMRPQNEVPGGVWLVGAFNNWDLKPDNKMKNNYGVYSITIPLKRGVYDYQYVTAFDDNGLITNPDWVTLEGNSWDTKNVYNIFVYYRDPNYGGYDRIIGYQQITGSERWTK